MSLRTSDFDFELPEELIAQRPPAERQHSRLLVLPRYEGPIEHSSFARLADHLRSGDLLVLNDTKVFPARLLGHRTPSGGAVECLLIGDLGLRSRDWESGSDATNSDIGIPNSGEALWEALLHPGQKLKPGARVLFERDGGTQLHGEIVARHFHGRRTIRLWTEDGTAVRDAIEQIGHIPLPPYIHRPDEPGDRDRYQTVYAREAGSIAAPTAGLHFTPVLLDTLAARGIERATVTLHVGFGTFKPVRAEAIEDHEVDPEQYSVPAATAAAITRALREGRRIIAVGTTTTRTLESLAVDADGAVKPATGSTQLFIRPGHTFRIVSGLITNFHVPRSSLLMLVAAFTGRERILAAYREAVELKYRFYSYGDGMVIL